MSPLEGGFYFQAPVKIKLASLFLTMSFVLWNEQLSHWEEKYSGRDCSKLPCSAKSPVLLRSSNFGGRRGARQIKHRFTP